MTRDVVLRIEHEWQCELGTPALAGHLAAWRKAHPALRPFMSPVSVLRFLHAPGDSASKDHVLEALLHEARSDVVAARFVLRAILPGLKRRMRRPLADEHERAELWSILFARAWESIRSYPRHGGPRRVAATLVLNIVRDSLAELRQRQAETAGSHPPSTVPAPSVDADPDSDVEGLLRRAVAAGALTDREATLVLATRIDGRPLASIAEAEGVPYNTIKLRRQRAERRLLLWLGYRAVPRGQQKRPSSVLGSSVRVPRA